MDLPDGFVYGAGVEGLGLGLRVGAEVGILGLEARSKELYGSEIARAAEFLAKRRNTEMKMTARDVSMRGGWQICGGMYMKMILKLPGWGP